MLTYPRTRGLCTQRVRVVYIANWLASHQLGFLIVHLLVAIFIYLFVYLFIYSVPN